MSTFKGRLFEEEFKDFSIDYFCEPNYDCKAFFLSHHHRDHMAGIEDPSFLVLFERPDVFLYCSSITKSFIVNNDEIKIPHYKIIILSDYGTLIGTKEGYSVKVTPLPAGHCPGSVMLLFEGFSKRILYTGDFRISLEDLGKLKPLHVSRASVVPIDSLYFDSTFSSENYEHFPSREQSLSVIQELVNTWILRSPKNRVIILQPALIGIEYLMNSLMKNLTPQKIHVSSFYHRYIESTVSSFLNNLTEVGDDAKVHFCVPNKCNNCYKMSVHDEFLLRIRPSALYFSKEILKIRGMSYNDNGLLRVAYSSHSSYFELRQFIKYLKPKILHPCVLSDKETEEECINRILNAIKAEESHKPNVNECEKEFTPENFLKKLKNFCEETTVVNEDSRREYYASCGLDSPPQCWFIFCLDLR